MTRYARSGLLGLMAAALTACGSSLVSGGGHGGVGGGGGGGGGQATPGSAGAGGGAGSTGGAAGGTGMGGSGPVGTPNFCVPGVPPTTQLRRMKNRQYEAVVRDLLGVTGVDTAAAQGRRAQLLVADSDGPMTPDAWRIYQGRRQGRSRAR